MKGIFNKHKNKSDQTHHKLYETGEKRREPSDEHLCLLIILNV